ncbi:hypothetical protein AB0M79_29545 [Polymorphospora sp. NPDC051019]|uniref:hypothetical protein n=1 Tax=Polymorphospora sp. NPDC051019 TaxID=3155725 RepID=UPI003413B240
MAWSWSWLTHSYQEQIVAPGKQAVLLLLVGLVLGFAFIRTSTRLIRAQVRWWPGNVSAGGVHLHHELFGVLIMLVAGTVGFAVRTDGPARDLLAFAFGVGAGLVLDEFALLLHLEDVYWTRQGRTSIDAVLVAVAGTGMLLVGTVPFGLSGISDAEASARWLAVAGVVVNLSLSVVTALKGKPWLALLSVAVSLAGLLGAIRLAAPDSPWARRFYRDRPDRRRRATVRARQWTRRKNRLVDLLGGPLLPTPPPDRHPDAPD